MGLMIGYIATRVKIEESKQMGYDKFASFEDLDDNELLLKGK
jgi:hypothetical protein